MVGAALAAALLVLAMPAGAQQPKIEEGGCRRVQSPGAANPGPYYTLFDTGKSAVKPADKPELKKIARQAQDLFVTRICLIGAADKVGNAGFNSKLARDRALAVARELMANGVPARNLLIDATGEAFAQWSVGRRENQDQDRRVTIVFAK